MPSRRPDTFLPGGSSTAATHQQQTSTGTADVKSFTTPPSAVAAYVTATTTAARVTLDGSTPAAGNGLVLPTGVLFECRTAGIGGIKFASTAAANCIVDIAYLV